MSSVLDGTLPRCGWLTVSFRRSPFVCLFTVVIAAFHPFVRWFVVKTVVVVSLGLSFFVSFFLSFVGVLGWPPSFVLPFVVSTFLDS